MIEMTGDLFTSTAPAIGHGVNLKGKMGAGIAVLFKNRFPKMYESYVYACDTFALLPGIVLIYDAESPIVYNIASQDLPGANARMEWLEAGLRSTLQDAQTRGLDRVALPLIGCGIGGLDEAEVVPLMEKLDSEYTPEIELWRFQ